MRRVQAERLIRQLFGFQPIRFYNRLRVLREGIRKNSARERILFIQLVGFAQYLNRIGGLLLREQFLAFGDKTVRFRLALDALVGELFQFGQLRIVREFSGRASQQFLSARVIARTQTGVDLLNDPRSGSSADLLIECFLQTLRPLSRFPCAKAFGIDDFRREFIGEVTEVTACELAGSVLIMVPNTG